MNARCASRVVKGFAVFAAVFALPLVVPSPIAGAESVPLIPRPATVPPIPSPATVLTMGDTAAFHGLVCRSPNTCSLVLYPWFVTPLGVTALQDAVTTTSADTSADKIVVFGYSNGALVAEQWLEQHLHDPNIPSPDRLSFVVIGNPARDMWPDSPYQVIDVSRQYDGVSDVPNNPDSPYYLLAVMNAVAGFGINHLDYRVVDLDDPANAVWKVGNTTYVLTPSPELPLLAGLAPFFPALNEQLKAAIETAYIRPVPFPTTNPPPAPEVLDAASELRTSVVSDPSVAPQHTTVPVSLTPAPAAPTATGLTTANGADSGASAAGTVPTTPPAVPADDVVQPITPAAAMRGLDNLVGQTRSITEPTSRTLTSTANGNMVVRNQIRRTRVTTQESQRPLTQHDVRSGDTGAPGSDSQATSLQDGNDPESGTPE
jgi:pimeloyl-ACP methyl ester carboxylesterase